jgi:Zn-dependent protease with chaperone function
VLLVALPYVSLVFVGVVVILFGLGAPALIAQAPRVPIVLIFAMPAVVIACFWGMAKGLIGVGNRTDLGVDATAADEPHLWQLSCQTAAEVGTRPADIVHLSPLPGISVHEEGGLQLLMGRTRRVLTTGDPSIVGLSVVEFVAILGHEYGHPSNKDTAWSSLTFRAWAAVRQTLASMDAVGRQGVWFALVGVLNPGCWVVLGYLTLLGFVTSGFSRMREVFADAAAVRQYGATAFKGGLRTVVINDQLFITRGLPAMVAGLREGKAFVGIYDALGAVRTELPPAELAEVFQQVAARAPSAFDSHRPSRIGCSTLATLRRRRVPMRRRGARR